MKTFIKNITSEPVNGIDTFVFNATLVNLTPHAVNLGSEVIAPSGKVARVASGRKMIALVNGHIPLCTVDFGNTMDLPAVTPDTLYIVSAMVRAANPSRKDLISPGELTRDAKGNVVGCNNFDINV